MSDLFQSNGEDTVDGGQQYLVFSLSRVRYAIDILQIREIIEFGQLTEVPMMPRSVRGVINLRGSVVPVIDLSARFGKEATLIRRLTCVIIVEVEFESKFQVVGLMVDGVNEVMDIVADDVESAPSFGTLISPEFILGMAKVADGGFITILDLKRVLSLEEWAGIEQMGQQREVREGLTNVG